jgi:Tat protein secretion system quality control protein TatD with DNase activity
VAEMLAQLLNIPLMEVAEKSTRNACDLFNLNI